eukprot:CAMPEP_0172719036 /NCGR_PEP_ID=MMETSP1074-20121228/75270_1 /TAXON_ID=2916 /ORGANISM="Ceratium fusus, Strain PA161109" /LENGTH=63 /DNA_ID=CAMNT_0013544339 /DNA_START=632 /DNA_END=823 /DNA_ORIENTATION=+
MIIPWIVSRLNRGLKKRCDFEYALQKANAQQGGISCNSFSRQGSATSEAELASSLRRISSAIN